MSNVIELNNAEIDTVVGGVNASLSASLGGASRPTAMMVQPNKPSNVNMFSIGNHSLSALPANLEMRR